MSKVICIPDANVLQHLEKITIGGKDIRDWLLDELDILPTEKVLDEFDEGCKMRGVTDPLSNKLRKLANSIELEDEIREALNNLAGRKLSAFADAELACVRFGLRLLKTDGSKVRHIIFLSDDLDAFQSEQGKDLLDRMPPFCFWTSADVVLYLVFRIGDRGGVGMRKEDFFNALETAIQRMCPALDMPSHTTMKEQARRRWQEYKEKYLIWLESVYEGSSVNW